MRILLGVSGGIAAYKAAELVRRLRGRGHEVRCVLTRGAAAFVTPLTLEVLSGAAVYGEDYLCPGHDGGEQHITAARWADALLIAPATAHVLARLALGLADDFLTTTALASRRPLVLAPAMHPHMWEQEPVARHAADLARRGAVLVGPVAGPLASGEIGMGRMAEPEEIVAALERAAVPGPLAGRTIVVTAGPTREALDPVRYLSNRSSGRMGFALAAAAARRGARTILIAGPVALPAPPDVERRDVVSALDMEDALAACAAAADLVIMAAAVADFRPREVAGRKLKKQDGIPALDLIENPDLLRGLARRAPGAVRVGFAAESGDLAAEARRKLAAKRIHFLVANDVSRREIGFDAEDNEVTVYRRGAEPLFFSRRPKSELAEALLDLFTGALAGPRPAARGATPAAVSGRATR